MKTRYWLIIVFVTLVVGFGMGASDTTLAEQKTEPAPVVEVDDSAWRELKAIDDKLISNGADAATACSTMLTAFIDGDAKTITETTDEVIELTADVEVLHSQRLEKLKELGY